MKGTSRITKTLAAGLAAVLFLECTLVHAAEAEFWAERKSSTQQMASLPAGFIPPAPSPVLKEITSALSPRLLAKIPATLDGVQNRSFRALLASLPASAGTVRSVRAATVPSSRTLIHIQDVHLNADAQKNIGAALSLLINDKRLDLIGLEGASGAIDLQRLRAFADKVSLSKAADYALRKNEITGPIHTALITAGELPVVVGIDDEAHHQANIEAYKHAMASALELKSKLAEEKLRLAGQSHQEMNPALFMLHQKTAAYRGGELSLGSYARALAQYSDDMPLALEAFLQALEMEEKLNLPQVEAERARLLEQMVPHLTPQQGDELLRSGLAFRAGHLSQADYYHTLQTLCEQTGAPLARYPAMRAYIQYVVLSESIDVEAVFAALKMFEKSVYAGLLRTDAERRLVAEAKRISLQEKLLDLSLTKEEWEDYKTESSGAHNSFERFYEEAEIRDEAMARNMRVEMDKAGAHTAVLVTGGFHTQGIQARLKSDFNVITFVPRISTIGTVSGAQSLSIFLQEKTPLEKMFEGQKLFLGQNPRPGVSLPMEVAAVSPDPIGKVIREIFRPGLGITGEKTRNGRITTVTLKNAYGRITRVFQLDSAGNLLSDEIRGLNPIPEIIAASLLYYQGWLMPELGALNVFVFGVGSIGIRVLWTLIHILFSGARMESTQFAEYLTGLIPFAPIVPLTFSDLFRAALFPAWMVHQAGHFIVGPRYGSWKNYSGAGGLLRDLLSELPWEVRGPPAFAGILSNMLVALVMPFIASLETYPFLMYVWLTNEMLVITQVIVGMWGYVDPKKTPSDFLRVFQSPAMFPGEQILINAGKKLNVDAATMRHVLAPTRIISGKIPVALDRGEIGTYHSYRVQHLSRPGWPGKGGMRFDKSMSLDEAEILALGMFIKGTANNQKTGGAKGGVRIDMLAHSDAEKDRAMRAHIRHLKSHHALGHDIDVPAADVGTADLIATAADESIRLDIAAGRITHPQMVRLYEYYPTDPNPRQAALFDRRHYPEHGSGKPFLAKYVELWRAGQVSGEPLATITGKPPEFGGIAAREEATGYGVMLVTLETVKRYHGLQNLKGLKIALQGFGKVGYHLARFLTEQGAIICAIGEIDGTIMNDDGIDIQALAAHIQRLPRNSKKKLEGFSQPGTIYVKEGDEWMVEGAQILIPAALGGVINARNVKKIPKSAIAVVEAANEAVTVEADQELAKNRRNVLVVPGEIANAGGMIISNVEHQFNLGRVKDVSDEAIHEILRREMGATSRRLFDTAQQHGETLREAMGLMALPKMIEDKADRRPPTQGSKKWWKKAAGAAPEIVGIIIGLSSDYSSLAVGLLTAQAIRLVWTLAVVGHESSHLFGKLATDQIFSSAEAWNVLASPKIWTGMRPFQSFYVPSSSLDDVATIQTGDTQKIKVRLKALAGPFFSLAAALGTTFYLLTQDSSRFVFVLGWVWVLANGVFFALSRSDWLTVRYGVALRAGFACGFLDYVVDMDPEQDDTLFWDTDRYEPASGYEKYLRDMHSAATDGDQLTPLGVPQHTMQQLQFSLQQLTKRGRQAVGEEFKVVDADGNVLLLGDKGVNPKRGNLPARVIRRLDKAFDEAKGAGYRLTKRFFDIAFHVRFGTSTEPQKIETHPHKSPAKIVRHMDWSDPNGLKIGNGNFQVSVKHNGDEDGVRTEKEILSDHPLFIFGKEISYNDLRRHLSRIAYADFTRGDSPVITHLLSVLIAKGRFDAATRLGYLTTIPGDFEKSFPGFSNPSQVDAVTKTWGKIFEEEFLEHYKRGQLFINRHGHVIPNKSYVEKHLVPAIIARLKSDSSIKKTPLKPVLDGSAQNEKLLRGFVESSLFAFFEMDTYRALQMMMGTSLQSSTFGLSINNTLEPEKKFWMAHKQPATVGFNPISHQFIASSDPGSVLAGMNFISRILTLNDDDGEIMVYDTSKRRRDAVTIYSLAHHGELDPQAVRKRWLPLADNPYVTLPEQSNPSESEPKKDVRELVGVLKAIDASVAVSNRDLPKMPSNRITMDRFSSAFLKLGKEDVRWNIAKFVTWTKNLRRAPSDYRRETGQAVDLLIIADGPNYDLALQKAEHQRNIMPGVRIEVITGNEYMMKREYYVSGTGAPFHLAKHSLVLAISQSGMTFPVVDSIRHAEKLRKKGAIGDVFILAGEWFTVAGRSIGQEYFPDSDFSGRIFCNMSGSRRSEAYTMASATDYLLHHIFQDVLEKLKSEGKVKKISYAHNLGVDQKGVDQLRKRLNSAASKRQIPLSDADADYLLQRVVVDGLKKFNEKSVVSNENRFRPFDLKISRLGLREFRNRLNTYVDDRVVKLTGADAEGKPVESDIHRQHVATAQQIANRVSEQFFGLIFAKVYTFFSVLFHKAFFSSVASVVIMGIIGATDNFSFAAMIEGAQMGSALGLLAIWAIAGFLDAVFYAYQVEIVTYALRKLQRRTVRDRIGPRSLIIAGNRSDVLRDYFRAIVLEAPGVLQFASVEAGKIVKKFLDKFKDPVRGTMVLFQIDDRRMISPPEQLLAGAGKMAGNQTDSTRNWGVGAHVMIHTTNPNKKGIYKFPVTLVQDKDDPTPEYLRRDKVALDYLGELADLEHQIGGQVIGSEVGEILRKVKVPFYVRGSERISSYALEKLGGTFSLVFSALAVLGNSLLAQTIYGAERMWEVFHPGQGQSGLTVFTTQLVAPSPAEEAATRNIKEIAHVIYNTGVSGGTDHAIEWFPSPDVSAFSYVFALMYDGQRPQPPQLPFEYELDGPRTQVDPVRVDQPREVKTPGGRFFSRAKKNGVTLNTHWLVSLPILGIAMAEPAMRVPAALAAVGWVGLLGAVYAARALKPRSQKRRAPFGMELLGPRLAPSVQPLMMDAVAPVAAEVSTLIPGHEVGQRQVHGNEVVLQDSNGQVVEIQFNYYYGKARVTATLNEFQYSVDGRLESFTYTEYLPNVKEPLVKGRALVTEYNEDGQVLRASLNTGATTVEFVFQVTEQTESARVGVLTEAIITHNGDTTVVRIDPEKRVKYATAAEDAELPPLKFLPPLDPALSSGGADGNLDNPARPAGVQNVDALSSLQDDTAAGEAVQENAGLGISLEDAIAILAEEIVSAPVAPMSTEPVGELVELPAQDAAQPVEEVQPQVAVASPEAETPVTPVVNKAAVISVDTGEKGWSRRDVLAASILIAAAVARFRKKLRNRLRVPRPRRAATVIAPQRIDVPAVSEEPEPVVELEPAQVFLSANGAHLTLRYLDSAYRIHTPQGLLSEATFIYRGSAWVAFDGAMLAVENKETNEIIFEVAEGAESNGEAGYGFSWNGDEFSGYTFDARHLRHLPALSAPSEPLLEETPAPAALPLPRSEIISLGALMAYGLFLSLYLLPAVAGFVAGFAPTPSEGLLSALQASAIGTTAWALYFVGEVAMVTTLITAGAFLGAQLPVVQKFQAEAGKRSGFFRSSRLLFLPFEALYAMGFHSPVARVRTLLQPEKSATWRALLLLATPFLVGYDYAKARLRMLFIGTIGKLALIVPLSLALAPSTVSLVVNYNLLELAWGTSAVQELSQAGGVTAAAVQILSPFGIASALLTAFLVVALTRGEKPSFARTALGFHFVNLEVQVALAVLAFFGGPLYWLGHKIDGPTNSVLGLGHDLMQALLKPFGVSLDSWVLPGSGGRTLQQIMNLRWEELAQQNMASKTAVPGAESVRLQEKIKEPTAQANELALAAAEVEKQIQELSDEVDTALGRLRATVKDQDYRLHELGERKFELQGKVLVSLDGQRDWMFDQADRLKEAREHTARMEQRLALLKEKEVLLKAELKQPAPTYKYYTKEWVNWFNKVLAPSIERDFPTIPHAWTEYRAVIETGAGAAHRIAGDPAQRIYSHPYLELNDKNIHRVGAISHLSVSELEAMGVTRLADGDFKVPVGQGKALKLQPGALVLPVEGHGLYLVRPGFEFGRTWIAGDLKAEEKYEERRAKLKQYEKNAGPVIARQAQAVEQARAAEAAVSKEEFKGAVELEKSRDALNQIIDEAAVLAAELNLNREELQSEAARLESRRAELQKKHAELRAEGERKSKEAIELQAQLQDVEKQISQIKASQPKIYLSAGLGQAVFPLMAVTVSGALFQLLAPNSPSAFTFLKPSITRFRPNRNGTPFQRLIALIVAGTMTVLVIWTLFDPAQVRITELIIYSVAAAIGYFLVLTIQPAKSETRKKQPAVDIFKKRTDGDLNAEEILNKPRWSPRDLLPLVLVTLMLWPHQAWAQVSPIQRVKDSAVSLAPHDLRVVIAIAVLSGALLLGIVLPALWKLWKQGRTLRTVSTVVGIPALFIWAGTYLTPVIENKVFALPAFGEAADFAAKRDVLTAWIGANSVELIYWGGLSGMLVSVLLFLQSLSSSSELGKSAFRELRFRIFWTVATLGIGAVLLQVSTIGFWARLFTTLYVTFGTAYMTFNFLSWLKTIWDFNAFRSLVGLNPKPEQTQRSRLHALLGIGSVGAALYLGARGYQASGKPLVERLNGVLATLAAKAWDLVSPDPETKTESDPWPDEYTLSFAVSPLIDEDASGNVTIPVQAQVRGKLMLDPRSKISKDDYKSLNKVIPVEGGEPIYLIRLDEEETQVRGRSQMSDFMGEVFDYFKKEGAYGNAPAADPSKGGLATRTQLDLFSDEWEIIQRDMEIYGPEQAKKVYGERNIPLPKGRKGYLLHNQVRLVDATVAPDTVMSVVYDARRAKYRVTIPTVILQRYDIEQMKPVIHLDGEEIPLRGLLYEYEVAGDITILTMDFESADERILVDWDFSANAAKPAGLNLNLVKREKPFSFVEQLEKDLLKKKKRSLNPVALVESQEVTVGERVSFDVQALQVVGTVDFNDGVEDAGMVSGGQQVVGVAESDQASLKAFQGRVQSLIDKMIAHLEVLAENKNVRIADMRTVPAYPKQNATFGDRKNAINEFLTKLKMMTNNVLQTGILVGKNRSQGQPLGNGPVARVLTPRLTLTVRLLKEVKVAQGEVCIVTRPWSGRQLLGEVISHRELADKGSGDALSDYQEVTVQVDTPPDFWIYDGEIGLKVVMAPASLDAAAQETLREMYALVNKRSDQIYQGNHYKDKGMPRPVPGRFTDVPTENGFKVAVTAELNAPSSMSFNEARVLIEGAQHPRLATREQLGLTVVDGFKSDIPGVNEIVNENQKNPQRRRVLLEQKLRGAGVSPEFLREMILNGQADVAQMSLDYLRRRQRLYDLIVIYRDLVAQNKESDAAKLARAYIFELIESGKLTTELEDPLTRLVRDPNRKVVGDFFVSVLASQEAAFDPATAIVARRILASDFWLSHSDKLALAHFLEKQGHAQAAQLVRHVVFELIAVPLAWKQGQHQKEVKEAGFFDNKISPDIFDRLHIAEKNDQEDRRFMTASPYMLSTEELESHMKGRIYEPLYNLAKEAYDRWNEQARELTPETFEFMPMASPSGGVVSDHVFKWLDPRVKEGYSATLAPHALARFILMAEHPGQRAYLKRRDIAIGELLGMNTPVARLELARLVLATQDQAFLRRVLVEIEKVETILMAELERVRHEMPEGPQRAGVEVIYYQALARLAGTMLTGEKNKEHRLLIVRSIITGLTDFELASAIEGDHPIEAMFVAQDIPAETVRSVAREELTRRLLLWSTEQTTHWLGQTSHEGQKFFPVTSTFENLGEALKIEHFNPERVQRVLEMGDQNHRGEFERVLDIFDRREAQMHANGRRDHVSQLETDHFYWRTIIGGVGIFLGVVSWGVKWAKSLDDAPAAMTRRQFFGSFKFPFLPKALLWLTLSAGAWGAGARLAEARPVFATPRPPVVSVEQTQAAEILRAAPPVQSNDLGRLGDMILAQRDSGVSRQPHLNVWEIRDARQLELARRTIVTMERGRSPDQTELYVLVAGVPALLADLAALRAELRDAFPAAPVAITAAQNGVVDLAQAVEDVFNSGSANHDERLALFVNALQEHKMQADLYMSSEQWDYKGTAQVGGMNVAVELLLNDASLHWLDLVNQIALSIPINGDLSRALETLRHARDLASRGA